MNERKKPAPDDIIGVVLARLGREVMAPLNELIARVHALDERASEGEDDETAAHLVELGHRLQTILEPVTALARLEATPASKSKAVLELSSLLEQTIKAPDLAASFKLTIRGALGTSFVDKTRFEQGLLLCLRLLARMVRAKTVLQAHREVHAASDRIVMAVRAPRAEPVALELLKRLSLVLGACIEAEGVTLRFCFPVADEPSSDQGVPAKPAGPVLAFRRDETPNSLAPEVTERASIVLVVDDEPAARDYLSRILELEGFDVVKSSTLQEAYAAAHAYKPDVITVDRLQLAREDGDWLRRFKEDPALARIPLVLVQSEESESLGLVGVADVVRKPLDPDEIVDTVDRLTGRVLPPILVVRNERDVSTWDACFEASAIRKVVASTVAEAERVLDTVTPAALVIDVRNGEAISLLEELRRDERTRDIPVIAVHGRLTKRDRLSLESMAARRLAFGELDRRSLHATLEPILGAAHHSGFEAG